MNIPPRHRRGSQAYRDLNGRWVLFGEEEEEDLSPVPPILPRGFSGQPDGDDEVDGDGAPTTETGDETGDQPRV